MNVSVNVYPFSLLIVGNKASVKCRTWADSIDAITITEKRLQKHTNTLFKNGHSQLIAPTKWL